MLADTMTHLCKEARNGLIPNWTGIVGRLFGHIHQIAATPRRLAVVQRISVGPRQSIALIEADGEALLVGTSSEGPPQFYRISSKSPSRGQEWGPEIRMEGTVS